MSSTPEYTPAEKLEVLELVERLGNVSKAAEQSGVSRGSIYKWQGQKDKLRDKVAGNKSLVKLKDEHRVRKSISERLTTVEDLDAVIGDLEDRRLKLADKVEYILIKVIDLIESHPDLEEIHPKDLSKIMTELNAMKKDLRREPDFIIEFGNNLKAMMIQVLAKKYGPEETREVIAEVEKLQDAEYEIL